MGDFSKKSLCAGLMSAVMAGNPVVLQGLMAQGADVNYCSTLFINANNDNKARLSDQQTYFARQGGARTEFSMSPSATHGMSLLNYAILGAALPYKKENLEPRMKTIALLSSLGINKATGVNNKWTPLHVASQICQPELILLLLSMGADPMVTSDKGLTGPEMVPKWCPEGLEAYRFYYANAPEKPKKK